MTADGAANQAQTKVESDFFLIDFDRQSPKQGVRMTAGRKKAGDTADLSPISISASDQKTISISRNQIGD